MNLEIAEASQGMNVEISQTRQGIKLELAFGLTQTKADARYASQTQVTTLTTRIATAETAMATLDEQAAKQAVKTIRIGNVNVTATLKNDTIIITASGGINITGDATSKTITIDTTWLKNQIVALQTSAATLAFIRILSGDTSESFSAQTKNETLAFKTLYTNKQHIFFGLDKTNKVVVLDIRTLEQEITTLTQAIAAEITNRTTAINQAITTEVSNRNSAIATAVQTETTARQTADGALQNNIDGETSARQSADETLQDNINAEATARQTADNNLQAGINASLQAVSAEETRAKGQEQANAAAITAANQMLQLAAQTMAAAIEAEKDERQAGDAEITAALTTVDGKVVLNDEITAAILANLNGRIAAIEESIKNGFAGLTVDNLFVKTGMRSYFFNGETDDDALVVVRGYAPNIIPKHYGQRWFDTAAKKWYKPQGLTSVSDWVVDN